MAETKGWKQQRTSRTECVEVDLSDFDTEQLLQALIDDGAISEGEAVAIKARGTVRGLDKPSVIGIEPDYIDDAWNEIIRGRKGEALYCIERALGNQWVGRLS
jgi:hypothetical protein